MKMNQITIKQAIDLLKNDKTAHKMTVYFVVGDKPEYNTTTVEINGHRVKAVAVDAGKISSESTLLELASAALFGGIYA